MTLYGVLLEISAARICPRNRGGTCQAHRSGGLRSALFQARPELTHGPFSKFRAIDIAYTLGNPQPGGLPVRHSLATVKRRLLAFRSERDWEQFHTPKNLAGSICIEAAELLEHFQWKSGTEKLTAAEKAAVAHELADVFIYTVLMANDLKIDLLDATMSKLKENARKY